MSSRKFRKVKIVIINLVVAALFLEVGAYFVHPLIFDEKLSRGRIQERLDADAEENDAPQAYQDEDWLASMAVHPYLGYASRPSVAGFSHPDGTAIADTIYAKSENRIIVGISGGSVARALYVDAKEFLEDQLKRHPALSEKEVVVHSLSLSGYKQPQQFLSLAYYLLRGGHVDIWINLDGFNDIALPIIENYREGVALGYPRSWPVFAQGAHHPEMLDAAIEIRAARKRRDRLTTIFALPVIRDSAFCLLSWSVFDRLYQTKAQELNRKARSLMNKGGIPNYVSGPIAAHSSEVEAFAEAARLWKQSSLQMADMCKTANISYFHFLQPNQHVADSKTFTEEERPIAIGVKKNPYPYVVEKGYPILREAGRELQHAGIAYHDLTGIYAEVPEAIYIDPCCHVNKTGSEIMARAIADRIVQSYVEPD